MRLRKQFYRKRSITTSFIAFLLISSVLFGINLLNPTPLGEVATASPGPTTMYVDPPSIIDPSLTPGKTFTVKLMVAEVEDLSNWQVFMTFDASIVKATLISQGDFMAGQPEGTIWSSKISTSYVMFGEATKGKNETTGEPYPGKSGSGWLGSVKFEVQGTGATVLNITNPPYTYLEKWSETPPYVVEPIPCEMENGYFSNTAVTYTLTVHSDPISGIDFTVDGISHTTSWSGSLSAGSHTLVMPSTWTVGTDVYNFDHWEDASTSPTRIITLTAAKTVTAYYVLAPKYWTLTVHSDPISGVEFTLDGVTKTTPYSESLIEGSHTIVMPSTWTVGTDLYNFDHWEDTSTNPTRTVSLTSDKTVTAYYEYVPETHTLTVNSNPISGVDFTVDGVSHTTSWSGSLSAGSHTLVMPSSWGTYNFDHWEDMSTNPTRTISLTADKTVTAYYVKRQWTLSIDSDPFDGVDFTLDGSPHTTPWSSLLDEGSHTIVMPSTWTVGLDLYSFDHWEDMSTNPTRTVSLTADKTVTAYYVLALERYELVIGVDGSGTTIPSPDTYVFDAGTEVTVASVPDPGWMLNRWELDGANVGSDDTYAVIMNTNHTLIAFFVEIPPTHQLTVNSDPVSGVEFTLDGVTQTTPYSDSLAEGSHTLVMPSTWTVGTDVYSFDHWEDVSTNPTRTISLTADKTVTAYYVLAPKYWTLTVNSDPIDGVEFTLNDTTYTTSYSESIIEGSYTIIMPLTWTVGTDVYEFDHWEDASTDPTRTISLTSDKTVTAYYMYVPKTYTLTVNSDPITGVEFTLNGTSHATSWSDSLTEGTYSIVMPSTWTVGSDVYNFDHWEDASTDPTRVITLAADMTVTAYYVLAPKYWTLTVDSDPIDGVEFTVDGVTETTPYSDSLAEGSHTLVMPSTWTVGTDIYNFDHWEDSSTNPTRSVTLTSDTAVIAYYTLAPVAETVVAVDPPISTANPGEYFTINITIANVTDLYSWAFKLKWPTGLLECKKENIIEGPFLKAGGSTVFTKKAFLSYIDVGCMLLMAPEGVSGSGTLATVTFKVLKTGNCTLELYDVTLMDSKYMDIPHAIAHGTFYSTYPVASYKYSPHPQDAYGRPIVGETVTFNATTSYDPDQSYRGQTGIGISLYEWDFNGDGTYDHSSVDPYATHVYGTAGDYRVILRVTDDDGENSTVDQPIIGTTIRIQLHDIAVINVTVTPTIFVPGTTVTINVTVLNKGSVTEQLNVTVYKDSDAVKTVRFIHSGKPTLLLGENGTTTIEWDTTGLPLGTYTIKVYAFLINPATLEAVPGIEREEVLFDNWMTYGTITVVGPDFELAASPTSLSILQGGSDTSTITVTSLNDFSDLVALSVSGEPFDVTVTLDPKDVTPPPNENATSTLTVSVGIAATPGSYTLTITATSGTLEHSIDIPLEITELPPTKYQLTVNSDPVTGVEFTLNGVPHATPWSDLLDEGSYTVVMPASWTVGADLYNFDHWEDASTNPTRTISLTADKTVTAYYVYVPETHTLTVNSNPISGVDFTVDGVSHTTSWSGSLSAGSHTLVMPSTWTVGTDVYSFDHWEDASTNPTRTISLTLDMVVTAYYVLLPAQYDLTIEVVGSGTTDPSPGTHTYDKGTEVIVDALPDPDWMLDHWELDGFDVGDADPYTVTMDDNHTLIAFFVETPIEQPPVASFTYSPMTPATDETVTFDASASYDPDGIIVSYAWGFGDGTSGTGEIVTHIYADNGTYTVTLTVTDNDGLSDTTSKDITVLNRSPVAIFTESATTVFIGEVIYFNASDSYDPDGSIVSYFWDFGDGANATGVVVEHAYADEGTYTVTLAVTDDDGATDTATATKTVLPPELEPPVASFTYSPLSPLVNETLTFDASASYDPDGMIVSYEWDFDDGTTGTGVLVTHAYTMAGTYTVMLTVADDDGLTDTTTADITVSTMPPDVTPPTITIHEPTAKDYLHSEVITLDFYAVDTESGVASISATLNGMTVENGDTIELFTLSLGPHTLTVTAVDHAGNSATETVEFNIVATIDSLISLVEKFYELGHIDKKGIELSLLAKLYAAKKKLEAGQTKTAKNILNAFINQLKAQSGKHISEYAADILIKDAQSIIADPPAVTNTPLIF